MKTAVLLAAGLVGSAVASAGVHRRHHGHDAFHHNRRDAQPSCGCTTKTITSYGEPTLYESTTTVSTTSTTTEYTTVTPEPELPTPIVTVFPTPGTYTIEPKTVTVTKETTVCAATSTDLSPGENTYGGITTVVETATTIVCPVATVSPSGTTHTSIITTTTFVCPSAGTYTIAPSTTSVSKSTVIVYPTPAVYPTGTYTQPGATVTVTETNYEYVCPAPTSPVAPPPPPPAPETPAYPEAPAPAPPPAIGGGEKWAMTYSPYTNEGQCKDGGAVAADIIRIKNAGFNTVRVYAPDCDGLKTVGDACAANGMKMIIGIFISATGINGAQEQVNQIISWGRWDMVELIVVGNEAIFQGHADGPSLAGFVASCKGAFKGAGYSGPVTTTEPLNIWQANAGVLCGVVDVVGANIHPYFNSGVDSAHAGQFTKGQMDILFELCGGKDVYNLETGWPNGGSPNGAAIPGPSEQATALKGIADLVGPKSVFFSFENDGWKNPGPFNVEQHWGCIDNFIS